MPAEINPIAAWTQTKFGSPFEISFKYADELPRTKAGKFQHFVSEIPKEDERHGVWSFFGLSSLFGSNAPTRKAETGQATRSLVARPQTGQTVAGLCEPGEEEQNVAQRAPPAT